MAQALWDVLLALIFSFSLVGIVILSVHLSAPISRFIRRRRAMVAGHKCHKKLHVLPPVIDHNIILLDPDDPKWSGNQEYVKWRLEQLIVIARDLGWFRDEQLPVRVGVVGMYRAYDALAFDESCIALSTKRVSQNPDVLLDILIVHEFTHLVAIVNDDMHGQLWKERDHILFYTLYGIPPLNLYPSGSD